MKNFNSKIVCLVFALTSFDNGLYADNEAKSQLVISLTDPGKPGILEITGLMHGSIKVTGYEGKEIVIDVVGATIKSERTAVEVGKIPSKSSITVKNEKDSGNDASDGMKRISGGGMDIIAEEKNNHVFINVGFQKQSENLVLKIQVPKQFNLNLNTIDGEIKVEEVNGQMEITNVNGGIELNNVSGSVVANTVNENIMVKFKEVALDSPMAFSTVNGNLDVTFPANIKASIKLKSEMGEVFTNFDIDIDKNEPKVEKSSRSDRNWIKVESWIYGKINGGGPEVLMKNMQGNIYLRKTK